MSIIKNKIYVCSPRFSSVILYSFIPLCFLYRKLITGLITMAQEFERFLIIRNLCYNFHNEPWRPRLFTYLNRTTYRFKMQSTYKIPGLQHHYVSLVVFQVNKADLLIRMSSLSLFLSLFLSLALSFSWGVLSLLVEGVRVCATKDR